MKASIILPFIVTLFWSFSSAAHKLSVFVWTEGSRVTVESSLSGGRTLVHGTVEVIDTQTKETIVTGKSDTSGAFSFTLPEKVMRASAPLDIIVSGGDGHKAHWVLQPEDYGSVSRQNSSPTEPARGRLPQDNDGEECLSKAEFERVLNENLEQKLAPLRKNIASLVNHSPTLSDIGGGIGYLIGCAGFAAWFRSRKQKKNEH